MNDKCIATFLAQVERGCLSDSPGIELYREKGYDQRGFLVYLCGRGTSTHEGTFHRNWNSRFEGYNVAMEYADIVVGTLRFRTNANVELRTRPGIAAAGHFALHQIEVVNELAIPLWRIEAYA